MPKKMIINVEVHNDKCRSKAMKIAAVRQGVNSVSMEGEGRDQLVVTGEGVDSVELVNVLRKKIGHAMIVSVQDLKPADQEEEKEKKPEEEEEVVVNPIDYYSPYDLPPLCYQRLLYDPYHSNNGFIWYSF